MVGFTTKFLFATTVTAPTFLSLGLIGIIKDSEPYLSQWKDLFTQLKCPTILEWWGINIRIVNIPSIEYEPTIQLRKYPRLILPILDHCIPSRNGCMPMAR